MCGIWLGVVVERGQHQPPAPARTKLRLPSPQACLGRGIEGEGKGELFTTNARLCYRASRRYEMERRARRPQGRADEFDHSRRIAARRCVITGSGSTLGAAQRTEFMQAGVPLPTRSSPHPPSPSPQTSLGRGGGCVVFG
jgi:hypothetical protein